jgi:hypothetical protein
MGLSGGLLATSAQSPAVILDLVGVKKVPGNPILLPLLGIKI